MKKLIVLVLGLCLLMPGSAISKQKITFKVYLDVSGDDIYSPLLADYVRSKLREHDDIVFVPIEKAKCFVELAIVRNPADIFAIHSQVIVKNGENCYDYPMAGSIVVGGHFEELKATIAADLNESFFEKIREAGVQ